MTSIRRHLLKLKIFFNSERSRNLFFLYFITSLLTFNLFLVFPGYNACAQELLSATFDTDSSGFTYHDDTFRSTGNPGYASGNYDSSGGFSGGGLHVALGGVDTSWEYDMSGGWSQSFVVTGDATVKVTLWYRLVFSGDYESDECGQALVAIDGQLTSEGSQDYLEEFCGFGDGNPTQDTGWRQATLEVFLTDGTHTITVGGWNNKKTYTNEVTDVFFDEIVITQQGQTPSSETNCADGLDNDGDGLTDCSDADCIGSPSCSPEIVCDDGIDNDSDGLTDCDDPDCFGVAGCSAAILSATFDTDSSGFTYHDDTFRSTGNPGYASGNYDSSGGFSGGGLHVALGGVDTSWEYDMSGGWSQSFVVTGDATVKVTLWYRLVFSGDYESDECGQALVAIDGQLTSEGSQDYLEEFCGFGDGNPTQDTGWRQATLEVFLTDGTHTITVGGWNNKKTYTNEVTDVFFDEIVITQQGQTPSSETNCADGLDNDGDGLTDCSDADCIGSPSCSPEIVCDDGIDNDSDGLTDCDDPDCFGVAGCSAAILSATFDTDSSGFTYHDDTFRSTGNPGYASGNYDSSGGFSGGGLHVALGGVDTSWEYDMSGGWSQSFVVTGDATVKVTLWYRLVFSGDYESDECGQALVAIDGQLTSEGSQDYLEEFCGFGDGNPTQDTGWRQATLEVFLTDGTHTITVGGWNNKKTYTNEVTDVFFDEIVITQQGQTPSSETNCADGLDNDGDGLTDCSDADCIGSPSCSPEIVCDDGIDNDSDGLTDCDDPDCFGVAGCSAAILSATFDTDSSGFTYHDDTFRSTGNPGYASGNYDSSGGFSGGGLHVALGGVDTSWEYDMSGGWSQSFVVNGDATVKVTLWYRLVFSGDYESDECGQALVAIDGQLLSAGSQDYLEEFCGFGDGNPTQDTGWRQVTLEVTLTDGTHTITVGGWNNKKTYTNEVTDVFFDEIVITQTNDTRYHFF